MRLLKVLFLLMMSNVSLAVPPINIQFTQNDLSQGINNVNLEALVTGGQPPYAYFWSQASQNIYSNKLNGLTEGQNVHLRVIDANGNEQEVGITIESPNTLSEKINSFFKPIVGVGAQIFFWDPFTAMGIYDPVLYRDSLVLNVPLVNGQAYESVLLKEWLVNDGEDVGNNEPIAILDTDKGELFIRASGEGMLHITKGNNSSLLQEGSLISFGQINYMTKSPDLNPNRTSRNSTIPFIVLWLVIGAVFFTLKMRVINFKGIKHAVQLIRGDYDDPKDPGEVSHFQALTTALSATVGLGNIASVAVAISIGGPGATFWMILAGVLGMSSKFVECTLGVKYRIIKDGEVYGGPMYYLSRGLEKRNLKILGRVLAVLFAVLCIGGSIGGGCMFQANQAFVQMKEVFTGLEGNGFVFGAILSVFVAVVIIGGIKSIARVTDKIVPFMVVLYVLCSLIVILINLNHFNEAISLIIDGAFNPSALKGGVVGVLITGFKRAAFSNEAGVGSASIAHSASKTKEPVSEGIVALLEPFIDTVVVCTMTALVIIFTGYSDGSSGLSGAQLTSTAFSSVFPWFKYVLALSVLLFAFSTMVSWSYYGQKAWSYLLGETKISGLMYKVLFILSVIIGASSGLGAVLDFSDLMILGMALPNILGLLIMSGEVRRDVVDYFRRIKLGEIKKFK